MQIDISEWTRVNRGKSKQEKRFKLSREGVGMTLSEDEARRVWEAFAPYFDGREVSEG